MNDLIKIDMTEDDARQVLRQDGYTTIRLSTLIGLFDCKIARNLTPIKALEETLLHITSLHKE